MKELLGFGIQILPLMLIKQIGAFDAGKFFGRTACPMRAHATDDSCSSCSWQIVVRALIWVLSIVDEGARADDAS